MKNIKIYTMLFAASFMMFSCDEEDKLINDRLTDPDTVIPVDSGTPGSADYSTYVALGASITAGASDGTLNSKGQDNSFPKILAGQLALPGLDGGSFMQPDINSVNGYLSANADGSINGKLILDVKVKGIVGSVGEVPTAYAGDKTALNNFGVPGIQTGQILTPYTGGSNPGNSNPSTNLAYNALYARFASSPGTSTILSDAMARKPTFFTFWPGGNDILGYATRGGVNSLILTNPAAVSGHIDAVLSGLFATATKGVIINVPDVLALPFFQAVPYNAIPITTQADVDAANDAYAAYNGALQSALGAKIIDADEAALRTVTYTLGGNGIIVEDPTLTDVNKLSGGAIPIPKYRQMKAGEFVLLPASAILGTLKDSDDEKTKIGIGVPLADKYSLLKYEVDSIESNLLAINTKIATVAAINANLIQFDSYATFLEITESGGYKSPETHGFKFDNDFLPNGIFSNDGIHPNPRGSAIIVNEMITQMNKSVDEGGFGSSIPKVNITDFNSSPFR